MGRISMPIMNKTGYSMYWNSMWDDKLNYSRSLFESIFLKNFIYLFFANDSYFFHVDLKQYKRKFKKFKRKYKFKTKKIFRKNEIKEIIGYKYIKKPNIFKRFFSKIWILKYQQWVVIYFYSYTFKLGRFFKKKKKNKKIFKKYHRLITNYYTNSMKLKNDYYSYSDSFKNINF